MWALIGIALAAPPPMEEAGRIRTSGGAMGPDWGAWGELSLNVANRVALRGGSQVNVLAPSAGVYSLLELAAGPYWLQPTVAGGATLTVRDPDDPVLEPGWRAELGLRGLIRWGTGIQLGVMTDGARVDGRIGAYIEW